LSSLIIAYEEQNAIVIIAEKPSDYRGLANVDNVDNNILDKDG